MRQRLAKAPAELNDSSSQVSVVFARGGLSKNAGGKRRENNRQAGKNPPG
jgi:hypothetical protein